MSRNIGNRRGFTNGNVLANAKDTQHRAASSRGLTNGLGGGFTNGAGKTDGRGYTNGNGLINGMGCTNGLSQTNGFTNGLGSRRFNSQGTAHPKTLAVIIVVVLIAIVPLLFVFLSDSQVIPGQLVVVDGKFGDWKKMTKYADTSVCADTPLDIIEFAIAFEGTDFFAYIQTQGDMLARATVDRYFVFIDADGSTATGYSAIGLGADYIVEAYGCNGGSWQVTSSKFYGADQSNWSAFCNIGSGYAESKDSEMELKAGLDAELNIGGALRVRFASMTGSAMADVCAPIVDGKNGALVIQQTPLDASGIISTNSLLELHLRAVGKEISVNSLTIAATVNSMTISSQGAIAINREGFTTRTIAANSELTVQITGDVASLAGGTLVKASVTLASVIDATYNVIGNGLVAYAKAAPAAISIDGAFADWNGIQKTADSASDVSNPNIDIIEGAATVQSNTFLAYVKFNGNGNAMSGMAVPSARVLPADAGGGGGGGSGGTVAILPRVSGEDVTRIYIDSVAGGSGIGGISADYMIELKGKNGHVNSKAVYTYPAKILVAGVVAAAVGTDAIETSIAYNLIDNPTGTISMFVETTDWEKNNDGASPITVALVLSAGTRSGSPLPVKADGPLPVNLGTAGEFAILAASAIPNTGPTIINGNLGLSPATGAGITGLSAVQVNGVMYAVDILGPAGSVMNPALLTAAKNDLTAAYIDARDRVPVPTGVFLDPGFGDIGGMTLVPGLYKFSSTAGITGASTTLTGGSTDVWVFQIGTSLTMGSGIQIILAGGAQARNIFWQVGSSATIGTYSDFKGTIMADQSITINTGATLEGRALARIAAVTLDTNHIALPQNTVVINEVMFDNATNPDWFELHNPMAVTCDISGWKLVDGTDFSIYTYPAATSLAAGGYNKIDIGTSLQTTDYLALMNDEGTIIDFVAWGTSQPSGVYHQLAVDSFNWPSGPGQYVDVTGFAQGNTIGRDMDSTDTNTIGDWEITCGIDAGAPTPNEQNIPEFPSIAVLIILCAGPLIIYRAKRRIHRGD
jgi:hypothetical protein